MSMFTPVNQVRLTNVATVKLQKKGKRFEIACYRNKVLSYRKKLETDLGEVLQIDTIFTNVSKGMIANNKDLLDTFGTSDHAIICKEILEKGELQVSEEERGALYESTFRDIASLVTEKTINPETNRPYTINMIINAMKQIQYSVNMSKSSKSQALDVIRKLKDVMPIARASMLLRLICISSDVDLVTDELTKIHATTTNSSNPSNNPSQEYFVDIKVDPEHFRRIEEFASTLPSGMGRVEVLQLRMNSTATVGTAATTTTTNNVVSNNDIDEEFDAVLVGAEESKADHTVEERTLSEPPKTVTKETKATTKKGNQKVTTTSMKKGKQQRDDDELQKLLHQVLPDNDNDDNEDDDEDDEEYHQQIIMMNINNKKKKKDKIVKDIVDDEDNDDDEASTITSSTTTTTTTATAPATTTGSNTTTTTTAPNQKASKRDKRAMKDEKEERERQAKLLKDRLQSKQQQQSVTNQDTSIEANNSSNTSLPTTDGTTAGTAVSSTSKCNTCGGYFPDVKAYREHFKSEWHRFNLKRKLKNLPVIPTEQDFLALSFEELQL